MTKSTKRPSISPHILLCETSVPPEALKLKERRGILHPQGGEKNQTKFYLVWIRHREVHSTCIIIAEYYVISMYKNTFGSIWNGLALLAVMAAVGGATAYILKREHQFGAK